jgi:hypothetical protein
MSQTVDLEAARAGLVRAWNDIDSRLRPPPKMQQLIENVMSASDVTFKYILTTGYLAKFVNRAVHARALQTGSSLHGAYDARTLCHKVVVGFEKTKGNLFGLSNEPFVNKPARHPQHEGDNPQLRNTLLAQRLHTALEMAQSGSHEEVYQGLVHILRLGSHHAANEAQIKVATRVNLRDVIKFVEKFLQEADGGARLAGVWGAFTSLLTENGKVKVYSPNAADLYGKTAGDVEVYYDKILISASECKQRAMNLDDVNHGIGKALKKGVPEYNFVISAGTVRGQEAAINEAVHKNSGHLDLAIIDIHKEVHLLAAMLNPLRRATFGTVVVELLREMRKFESANAAAEIWNSITE